MKLPRLVLVEQRFPADELPDCVAAVRAELDRVGARERVRAGASVAIAVGSRGIDCYPEIVRAAAQWVREHGGTPFVVPAMGSHAGGSAESQRALLCDEGIGRPGFPAELRSSTETRRVGTTALGDALFLDALALQADALLVINRIKAHTDFEAPIESGVSKMLTVGLGKPQGAREMHRSFRKHGFFQALSAAAELAVRELPPLIGIAIIENEHHRCCRIEAMKGDEILGREPTLLAEAKRRAARLPMERLDLLIVEEIGKEISGSGMDTNVINRKARPWSVASTQPPRIDYIYVRSLSAESHGNAVGIGLADFCHPRVLSQIDLAVTYLNCLTSGTPQGAALPVHLDSDAKVFEAALDAAPVGNAEELKVAWIHDTLSLARFYVSEAVLADGRPSGCLRPVGEPHELRFDDKGGIVSPEMTGGNA